MTIQSPKKSAYWVGESGLASQQAFNLADAEMQLYRLLETLGNLTDMLHISQIPHLLQSHIIQS